jgi:hypothetical protein
VNKNDHPYKDLIVPKEAVWREVQTVYIGSYALPLLKVKQKGQTFKGYYKDCKFLREQSGFGWDKETATITASDQAWNDIIIASYITLKDIEDS